MIFQYFCRRSIIKFFVLSLSCIFWILVWTGEAFTAPKERVLRYKRKNVLAFELLANGQYDQAIETFNGLYLDYKNEYTRVHDLYPEDLESLFALSIAYAQKGEMDKAMEYVRKALNGGLLLERFLAGPRKLLKPLYESTAFQNLVEARNIELLHGPMLSNVTDRRAEFWLRTVHEVPVKVHISTDQSMKKIIATGKSVTRAHQDFTTVVRIRKLEPDTQYYYQLEIDNKLYPDIYSFRSYPIKGQPAIFKIGFGGGAGFTPWHEYMWETITSHDLVSFFQMGDNVYIDHPKYPTIQKYTYYRRQARPEYRAFTAQNCIYAIWDDHDFGDNDCWGGPDADTPYWKIPVWKTFKNNWNNPYYGGGEEHPGCWFDLSIGDVDCFFLDSRYYRENPESPYPSMLGQRQKKWLLHELETSKATFKIIASPVPWGYGAKPGSDDPWQGYKQERDEIFTFIEEHRIDGVILISADRHRSDIWKYNREPAYPLYEFSSSRLTNEHRHDIMPESIFGYNEKCSFGQLEFNTEIPDPTVTYKIYNIDDELIYSHTVTKSELSTF